MGRQRIPAHPDEDTLRAMIDDLSEAGSEERDHVVQCPECIRRVEDLLKVRSLLKAAAGRNEPAPRDLSSRALSRLRLRPYLNRRVQRALGIPIRISDRPGRAVWQHPQSRALEQYATGVVR